MNYTTYSENKTSLPVMYITPSTQQFDFVQDDILGMEVDPIESRLYVYFVLVNFYFFNICFH